MFHILGFIVSRDSYMNRWEVIQPAKEGKLEVSYRWFRTCRDAEEFCFGILRHDPPGSPKVPPFDTQSSFSNFHLDVDTKTMFP